MATKNSFYSRVEFAKFNRHKAAWVMVLMASVIGLSGCDSLTTRSDAAAGKHGRSGSAAPARTTGKTQTANQGNVEVAQPATSAPTNVSVPAAAPTAPVQPPSFLNKELPKIGLILGPGGMKTFAEIGVLREFARAKVPVHAVVGIEWGAVMGGLYANQGSANEVEWKALKLREQDLPGEGGFLSTRIKAQSVGILNDFMENVFSNATIEGGKIDYACPAYWSREDRFGWMAKGQTKLALRACLPYPPFFTDNGGVLAAPFAVEEAAAYLRSRGANVIVLVNVLANGELMPTRLAQGEQAMENLLWSEIRREMLRAKPPLVQHVLNINTTGHPITDFAGRRALIEKGAKEGADFVNKIVSEYGY
jgi:NTE family protein